MARSAGHRPRTGKHADTGHELGVIGGLAALSLDALSSVAYGPEAMMLVLIAAGTQVRDRITVPLSGTENAEKSVDRRCTAPRPVPGVPPVE